METVLHPREASAGDVNHLSEKDYQIKNILYIPWIFHYPTVKLLQDYRLKTLYKLSSPNLAHKTDWIHQYPAHKTEMSSHSWCLVAFVKQFTLKHEWKLYTFATVLHRYTLMNHCSLQWLCLNVSKRLYRLTPMTLSFKLIQ